MMITMCWILWIPRRRRAGATARVLDAGRAAAVAALVPEDPAVPRTPASAPVVATSAAKTREARMRRERMSVVQGRVEVGRQLARRNAGEEERGAGRLV